MVESVGLALSPQIKLASTDPIQPTASKIIPPPSFDENHFEDALLDDPAVAPCAIKFKKGHLQKINNHDIPFSRIIGTKALESAFNPYTVRITERLNPNASSLVGIPESFIRIMKAVDHWNGMPIQTGNRVVLFHKRFGFNPKMREITPEYALTELRECRYVKTSLGVFRDHSDGGIDSILALNVLPEHSYRLDSLNDLVRWYALVGMPFILGQDL